MGNKKHNILASTWKGKFCVEMMCLKTEAKRQAYEILKEIN